MQDGISRRREIVNEGKPIGIASDSEALDRFVARLKGRAVAPDHDDYETERAVWNGRIDRRPALVVKAASPEDIVTAVNFARDARLPLALRGAGHHPCGHGTVDGGVVLDLSGLKGIAIDVAAKTATVEPGVTNGEFAEAIWAQGLIVTVGSHGSVGLTGLTLGGGTGVLMGKYGLTADNLLSAEIVTADGERRIASEDENPDLFWAIRGGGGNFGVAASLTYRLHAAEPMLGGVVVHPLPHAADLLRFYRDFTASCPDELTVFAVITTGPTGHPVAMLLACYTGPLEEGEKLLAPLKAFGPPLVDMIQPIPYLALLAAMEEHDPPGQYYAFEARGLEALTDEAIDCIAEFANTRTSPGTNIVLYHNHGAAARVAPDATAFAARGVPYMLGIYPGWEPGDCDPHVSWLQSFYDALVPLSTGLCGINFVGESETATREAYGANYPRLQAIKARWDPDNLFRQNHNIKPA